MQMAGSSDFTAGKGQSSSSVRLWGVSMKSGGFEKQWEETVMVHIPKELLDTSGSECELTHTLLLLLTHSSQAAFKNRTKSMADTASGPEHF